MRIEALADPSPAASHLLTLAGASILLDAGLDLEAGLWLLPPGLAAGCEAADLPPPLVRAGGGRVLISTPTPAFKAALFEASPAATAVDAVLATSPAALLGLPYALDACSPGPGCPHPLILATDWAVDAAIAWVADLDAASSSASGGGAGGDDAAAWHCWGDADLSPAAVRAMPADTLSAVLGPTAAAALAAEPAGTPPAAPLPPAVAAARATWRAGPYPADAARAALASVRRVSYGEPVPLVPGGRLTATARPSGATPGGAAWEIAVRPPAGSIARVVYLSSHVPWPLPAAASTRLESAAPGADPAAGVDALNAALGGAAAAAAPLDAAGLAGADVLIYAPPGPPPAVDEATPPRLAGGPATAAAAAAATAAVKAGGCALLPTHPDGSAYALVEATAASLRAAGLGHIPLIWAGPGAARCLAAGVAGGEWMSPPRRALLSDGRPPVGAGDLKARGVLTVCAGLAELTVNSGGHAGPHPRPPGPAAPPPPPPRWRAPTVVFAPAASLRGDGSADGGPGATAAALARSWAGDGRAAVIWSLPVGGSAVPAVAAAPFLGGAGGGARLVDAAPAAVPTPAAAASLIAALSPALALVAPAAWEDALGGAAAGGGCGRTAGRLLPFAPGVGVEGQEGGDDDDDDGAWPADVDPVLVSAGKDAVLAASVAARDGRVAVGPPPPPVAAAAAGRLMAPALGERPGRSAQAAAAAPSTTNPLTVDALLTALKARGLGPARTADEPAAVAALAADNPAAAAALAACAAAAASSVSALVALPDAGAAIVLAPDATHVHGSGPVREAVLAAVDAAAQGQGAA